MIFSTEIVKKSNNYMSEQNTVGLQCMVLYNNSRAEEMCRKYAGKVFLVKTEDKMLLQTIRILYSNNKYIVHFSKFSMSLSEYNYKYPINFPQTNDNDSTHKNDTNTLSCHMIDASFWTSSSY